jgi:hypothetical protein
MKKIYALILLSLIAICNIAFGQYESEIITIKKVCDMTEDSAMSYFSGYDNVHIDDVSYFSSDFSSKSYAISYMDGFPVVSYIEEFDRKKFKEMKQSVKNMSSHSKVSLFRRFYEEGDYMFLVSKNKAFQDQMLISVTKK